VAQLIGRLLSRTVKAEAAEAKKTDRPTRRQGSRSRSPTPAPAEQESLELAAAKSGSWRRILLLVFAITLHNIPEGLAVGVSALRPAAPLAARRPWPARASHFSTGSWWLRSADGVGSGGLISHRWRSAASKLPRVRSWIHATSTTPSTSRSGSASRCFLSSFFVAIPVAQSICPPSALAEAYFCAHALYVAHATSHRQNFPEGLAVSMPLRRSGARREALMMGAGERGSMCLGGGAEGGRE
jgi:hypothetical protein